MSASLVGSEMCIRDSLTSDEWGQMGDARSVAHIESEKQHDGDDLYRMVNSLGDVEYQEMLDPALVAEGRRREPEQLHHFGVAEA
eukprot:10850250-Alexandrium_andersonii.AAC.1